MGKRLAAIMLLTSLLAQPAWSACQNVQPVACPECFAVAVIPDTQFYTRQAIQPEVGGHLSLITRYFCENKAAWTEPSTGKTMPILLAIHLGDLVQSGDKQEGGTPLAEWLRIDAAMDELDACGLRYLVTTGNHDYEGLNYEGDTLGYETYFGANRWTSQGHGCSSPLACTGNDGDWFIDGGDTIVANSRNNIDMGSPGPTTNFEARHRAGLIRSPGGQRFLFLGLEASFDFPPAAPGFEAVEGDDLAWPKQVLNAYPDVSTILFHHSMLFTNDQSPTYLLGPEGFNSDSIIDGPAPFGSGTGMQLVWDEIVEDNHQIFSIFSGHVTNPSMHDDFTLPRTSGPPVSGFLRNFQDVRLPGTTDPGYGAGWNIIAAFDPEESEIRIRSYRIDDTDFYNDPPIDSDHDGDPAPTECLDVDWDGHLERAIPFQFDRAPVSSSSTLGRFLLLCALIGTAVASLAYWSRRHAPG